MIRNSGTSSKISPRPGESPPARAPAAIAHRLDNQRIVGYEDWGQDNDNDEDNIIKEISQTANFQAKGAKGGNNNRKAEEGENQGGGATIKENYISHRRWNTHHQRYNGPD